MNDAEAKFNHLKRDCYLDKLTKSLEKLKPDKDASSLLSQLDEITKHAEEALKGGVEKEKVEDAVPKPVVEEKPAPPPSGGGLLGLADYGSSDDDDDDE